MNSEFGSIIVHIGFFLFLLFLHIYMTIRHDAKRDKYIDFLEDEIDELKEQLFNKK